MKKEKKRKKERNQMSITNGDSIDDLLGLALKNLLEPLLKEEEFKKKIKKMKKKVIVMEIIGIYPITLLFDEGDISILYDEKDSYDLKIISSLKSFVGIAEGKIGLVRAFITGGIKVKKIYRIFTILRFKSILFPALKRAGENPVIKDIYNIL